MSFFSEFFKLITENTQNAIKEASITNKKRMTENQAKNIGFKVWKVSDPYKRDCYEILKYNGFETDVTFPEYIDNLPVRIIGTNIFERQNPDTKKWENHWIETVHIPKTVILIKDYAFHDCKTLRRVYFEGDIPEIQPSAFMRCINLENPPEIQERITEPWLKPEIFDRKSPPKFETEIISDKFVRIKKIISCREEIVIPEKINGLPVVEVTGGVPEHRDERRRNWGNHTLKKLSFPDSVVKIGKNAFMKCWSLEHLKLPNNKNLETGEDSFFMCEKLRLENVIFPDGMDYGNFMNAFNSCGLLKADYYRKKRAEHNKRKDVFIQNGKNRLHSGNYKNIVINNYENSEICMYIPHFIYMNTNIILNNNENIDIFPIIIQCGRGIDEFYYKRKNLYDKCINEKSLNAEIYDENILSLIPSMKRKLDICYYRLISDNTDEKYKIRYLDFVRKHAKKSVYRAIDTHDRIRLEWCRELDLINRHYNAVLEYAKRKGAYDMFDMTDEKNDGQTSWGIFRYKLYTDSNGNEKCLSLPVSKVYQRIKKHDGRDALMYNQDEQSCLNNRFVLVKKPEFDFGQIVFAENENKFAKVNDIYWDNYKNKMYFLLDLNSERNSGKRYYYENLKAVGDISPEIISDKYVFTFYGFNDWRDFMFVAEVIKQYFNPDEINTDMDSMNGYFIKDGLHIDIQRSCNGNPEFFVNACIMQTNNEKIDSLINDVWHKCVDIMVDKQYYK